MVLTVYNRSVITVHLITAKVNVLNTVQQQLNMQGMQHVFETT